MCAYFFFFLCVCVCVCVCFWVYVYLGLFFFFYSYGSFMCTSISISDFIPLYNNDWLATSLKFPSDDGTRHMKPNVTDFMFLILYLSRLHIYCCRGGSSLSLKVYTFGFIIIYLYIVKSATLVPKASFSIATTPRCRWGRYSIPWIAPHYN